MSLTYLPQFHRLCYAEPPLVASAVENLHEFLVPELTLLSVPRVDVIITGPFEMLLAPILKKSNVEVETDDQVIVPCFTKQVPAILQCFPKAVPVASILNGADAQASMRSVVMRPHLGVNYTLKMSLAYRITSAPRTIGPAFTQEVVHMTELLETLLPPDFWIYREVAGVTGSGQNPEEARQISCIIREDLEQRATAENESLIIAAALYQRPAGASKTYAEILFGLKSWDSKLTWLRR
jgi:hypothetical protein